MEAKRVPILTIKRPRLPMGGRGMSVPDRASPVRRSSPHPETDSHVQSLSLSRPSLPSVSSVSSPSRHRFAPASSVTANKSAIPPASSVGKVREQVKALPSSTGPVSRSAPAVPSSVSGVNRSASPKPTALSVRNRHAVDPSRIDRLDRHKVRPVSAVAIPDRRTPPLPQGTGRVDRMTAPAPAVTTPIRPTDRAVPVSAPRPDRTTAKTPDPVQRPERSHPSTPSSVSAPSVARRPELPEIKQSGRMVPKMPERVVVRAMEAATPATTSPLKDKKTVPPSSTTPPARNNYAERPPVIPARPLRVSDL